MSTCDLQWVYHCNKLLNCFCVLLCDLTFTHVKIDTNVERAVKLLQSCGEMPEKVCRKEGMLGNCRADSSGWKWEWETREKLRASSGQWKDCRSGERGKYMAGKKECRLETGTERERQREMWTAEDERVRLEEVTKDWGRSCDGWTSKNPPKVSSVVAQCTRKHVKIPSGSPEFMEFLACAGVSFKAFAEIYVSWEKKG